MDFVTIREFRSRPAAVWDKLDREKELVITRNGKPFAVLTRTQPQRMEEDLKALRRARAMVALQGLQEEARERGVDKLSQADIDAEIAAARRGPRAKRAARR
jgi:antitoxin (DNA-binding transcriptional repressor) of toxin-antitoxin stability system